VAKQGMWPGKTCGQARHVARQSMWLTLTKVHEYPLSEWKLHALRVLGVLKGVYIIYLGGMPPLSL